MAPSVNYRPETQQWATRPADHAFPSSIPSKPHLTSHGSMSFSPYRIQHVNLSVPVGTLEQAEEFYGTVLGFAPDPVPQLQRDSLRWFRVGDTGQQVHVSFDEPNSGKTRCHPCFALRDGEALLELQKRIWDAFQKGGKAAPMAADEPGKENSGAKVRLQCERGLTARGSSIPPASSVGTMQATDSSSVVEVSAAPPPPATDELGAPVLEARGQRSTALGELARVEHGVLVPARLLHELVSQTLGLQVVSRQDGPGASRL
ncbi:hypothetical protein A1Q2_01496 [Trichosporon asahii var. asahii CBS 8904]|uniref:VOC domain-containing protein n=1 Tax=Trichosporon asahii var. asahii (strain CBS 8904) TaxID=1220162 RepID=K1WTJ2_TRIAC|nr:hypothetical protein A1Q2_01496 [Trichosporon asahii var. asahii CBS 8904]